MKKNLILVFTFIFIFVGCTDTYKDLTVDDWEIETKATNAQKQFIWNTTGSEPKCPTGFYQHEDIEIFFTEPLPHDLSLQILCDRASSPTGHGQLIRHPFQNVNIPAGTMQYIINITCAGYTDLVPCPDENGNGGGPKYFRFSAGKAWYPGHTSEVFDYTAKPGNDKVTVEIKVYCLN